MDNKTGERAKGENKRISYVGQDLVAEWLLSDQRS